MITVEREKNPCLDACQSCGCKGQMTAVTVTTIYSERGSSGSSVRLCCQCVREMAEKCLAEVPT